MKFKITKQEILKNLIWIGVLAVGIGLYYYSQYKTVLIQDSLFLSGLFFLCVGLYRVVRHLGLFDTTIYSFKKLSGRMEQDERTLDCYDYWNEHPYVQPVWEILFTSICAMVIGLIV